MDQTADLSREAAPVTLALDIGGTRLKAGLLDPQGVMVAGPVRVNTPHPATPEAVLDAIAGLTGQLGQFDRIAAGFPGVVRDGRVFTAPNLGTADWRGTALAEVLAERLHGPVRIANDATVQGLGVISGHGLECVVTLGTGLGFALFQHGKPAPHLELSQHPVRKGKTYDEWIGNAALKDAGPKRWNRRVRKAIGYIDALVTFDMLYIGGGNAKHVTFDLPERVHLVSNEAGITGGVRLWNTSLDHVFAAA
jgi:polyphosphate glucokinase